MPKVSVIVPNYNHAAYLKQRIDSILNQTFQDFELILLDDCSSDSSREVLSSYATHPKVTHVVVNEKNSGSPFAQWDKGILLAKGEYIWIAESDDYAEAEFLEMLINLTLKYSNVNVAYSASNLIDEDGNCIGSTKELTKWITEERWESDFVNNGIDECKNFLYIQNTIPNASAVIFKRTLYYTTSGGDSTYKLCGDWKLWFQMLLNDGRICYSSKLLNHFRQLKSAQKKYTSIFKPEALKLMQEMLSIRVVKNDIFLHSKIIERLFEWVFLDGNGFLHKYSDKKKSIKNLKLFFNFPFKILILFPKYILRKNVIFIINKIIAYK